MKRRQILALASVWPMAPVSFAKMTAKKLPAPVVAVPFISATQMLQGLLLRDLIPGAKDMRQAAFALLQSLTPQTAWPQHRPLWTQTMLTWERLAAVAVGPLVERRSARAIDFWPTRPSQIQRLLNTGAAQITTMEQLDTVGATARGLPALEWLFWRTDGSGQTLAYARLLAEQVLAESDALLAGYERLYAADWEESDAWSLYGEWFGQAVGGLDQLRIKRMVPDTRGKDSSPWVRGVSNQTAQSWLAQAQGLQAFLVGSPAAQIEVQASSPGMPVPGSLNSLLLGRGHMKASNELQRLTLAMLRTVPSATPQSAASVRAAQTAVRQLSAHANALAGDVLNISLGFTDADGD